MLSTPVISSSSLLASGYLSTVLQNNAGSLLITDTHWPLYLGMLNIWPDSLRLGVIAVEWPTGAHLTITSGADAFAYKTRPRG